MAQDARGPRDTQDPNNLSRDERIQKLSVMIKGIRVAMLTTLDPDGSLRSRPMAPQDADFDGELWFITKQSSGKVSSIQSDEHVNVSYADVDGHRFVSVAGRAEVIDDRTKIHDLWTPLMKAWFPDGPDDPQIVLIKVKVDSAEIWDSSGLFVELVGMAKSALTGRSYDEDYRPQRLELGTH